MAVYDLEEQDKLDDLKAWWTQWGGLIVGIIVAVAVIVIGVQGWRWWTQRQAMAAAVLYDAVSSAARANDPAKAKDAMAQLADKYGGTGYAPRAELLMAALLYENNDAAGAKAQLASIIDRTSEEELKQIARLRLASILFDEKQYDEALRTLDAKHDAPFAGVYSDTRGDILATAGRTEEARRAYQAAITELDAKSPYRNFVQLKLDSLPAAPAPAVPATAPSAAPAALNSTPAVPSASSAAPAASTPAPAPPKGATAPSTPTPAPTK